jgi:hypothetical protein
MYDQKEEKLNLRVHRSVLPAGSTTTVFDSVYPAATQGPRLSANTSALSALIYSIYVPEIGGILGR